MTRAEKQTLLLVSMVNVQLELVRAIGVNEKRKALLNTCIERITETGVNIKCIQGETPKEIARILKEIKVVSKEMHEWDFRPMTITMFLTVSLNILSDLQTKIKDKAKLKLLSRAEVPVISLWKQVDPGRSWKSYEAAERLTTKIYRRVGFEQ